MTKPLALIIEDDKKLANIFSLTLQTEFEVNIIEDGKIASARLTDLTPALVVLDLHLPHISGQKILQQIRADKRLAQTRVILATADASLAEYLREKVDLVLLKPISVKQLFELAKRLRPPDLMILD